MANLQFDQEFKIHSNYLQNFALKLTRDKSAADDLYQETAFRAFKNQDKYIAHTNIKGWLTTIMKNSFINHYRKRKRKNIVLDDTAEDFYINSSHEVTSNDGEMNVNIEEITKAIDNLEEGYRVPFLMSYQGYKYHEIQEAMNLPLGTIKSRIHIARKILRSKIENMYSELAA